MKKIRRNRKREDPFVSMFADILDMLFEVSQTEPTKNVPLPS